jgi:hypothetical protein
VLPDLTPKPAYVALQTMTRHLSGYRITRRLPLGSDQDYVLLLGSNNGPQKLAAWTLGDAHTVGLDVTAKDGSALQFVSGKGEISWVKVDSGKLELELTQLPQYVTVDGAIAPAK